MKGISTEPTVNVKPQSSGAQPKLKINIMSHIDEFTLHQLQWRERAEQEVTVVKKRPH